MKSPKVGDKVVFGAFDGFHYFATVVRVNRGVATIKYFVKGTGAVSYLPKADWDRIEPEFESADSIRERQSFAQLRWDTYYEDFHE